MWLFFSLSSDSVALLLRAPGRAVPTWFPVCTALRDSLEHLDMLFHQHSEGWRCFWVIGSDTCQRPPSQRLEGQEITLASKASVDGATLLPIAMWPGAVLSGSQPSHLWFRGALSPFLSRTWHFLCKQVLIFSFMRNNWPKKGNIFKVYSRMSPYMYTLCRVNYVTITSHSYRLYMCVCKNTSLSLSANFGYTIQHQQLQWPCYALEQILTESLYLSLTSPYFSQP